MTECRRYFLSYSSVDGLQFATDLFHALQAKQPPKLVWFDRDRLPAQAGKSWSVTLDEAISRSIAVLFVATTDSVHKDSVCAQECEQALLFHRPVIVIKLERSVDIPLRLNTQQHVDFSSAYDPVTKTFHQDAFDRSFSQLHLALAECESPAAEIANRRKELRALERTLPAETSAARRGELEAKIAAITAEVAEREALVDEQLAAFERARASGPPSAPTVKGQSGVACPFPPPTAPPATFRDRSELLLSIERFLLEPSRRVLTVDGRGGLGKTALVLHAFDRVRRGQLPASGTPVPFSLAGLVYLSATGMHRVSAADLIMGIRRCTPDGDDRLDAVLNHPASNPRIRMLNLLDRHRDRRVLVLLDNFETVLDPSTHELAPANPELSEALVALLDAPEHSVSVLLTTQFVPKDLALVHADRQWLAPLEGGLPSPYAEDLLRAEDTNGDLGLRAAPAKLLQLARERTDGNPRALNLLIGILKSDRTARLRLEQILNTVSALPKQMGEALAGYLYRTLDATARRVMHALAVFNAPVPARAVDYVLATFTGDSSSEATLLHLCDMRAAQAVMNAELCFFLHSIDRTYLLRLWSDSASRDPALGEMSLQGLRHQAAEYFCTQRKSRNELTNWGDVDAHLSELELRCDAEELDVAAAILQEIDEDFLTLWGHNLTVLRFHERLKGRITDKQLQMWSANRLATTYSMLGRYAEARDAATAAVTLSDGDSSLQGAIARRELGHTYYYTGAYDQAIAMHRQCLEMLQDPTDRDGAAFRAETRFMLSKTYAAVGMLDEANQLGELARAEAQWVGDARIDCHTTGIISHYQACLGDTRGALLLAKEALAIARRIRGRREEMTMLSHLTQFCFQLGQYQDCVDRAEQALAIDREVTGTMIGSWCNQWRAAGLFMLGDLAGALDAAREARGFDEPLNNPNVTAFYGIFALLSGDTAAATEAWHATVASVDQLLCGSRRNWEALDAKGLALSGLYLTEGGGRLEEACETFRAARLVTAAPGIASRSLRQVEMLRGADPGDTLLPARRAASAGGSTFLE